MKKRLYILVFCAVLFTAVYRVGFEHGDVDTDLSDVNGIPVEALPDLNEPNDLMAQQSDLAVH